MALIKLTPSQIMSYGTEIKGMATTASTLLSDINSLVNSINAGWKGLANSAFVTQYAELYKQIEPLPQITEGVGAKAYAGGETMQQLEEQLRSSLSGN